MHEFFQVDRHNLRGLHFELQSSCCLQEGPPYRFSWKLPRSQKQKCYLPKTHSIDNVGSTVPNRWAPWAERTNSISISIVEKLLLSRNCWTALPAWGNQSMVSQLQQVHDIWKSETCSLLMGSQNTLVPKLLSNLQSHTDVHTPIKTVSYAAGVFTKNCQRRLKTVVVVEIIQLYLVQPTQDS